MDDKMFKEALQIVMDREVERLAKDMESSPKYKFTPEFERKVQILIHKTNRKYVTLGKYTIRRSVLVAIIAAIFLTGCVGIKAIREAITQVSFEFTDKNVNIHIDTDLESSSVEFEAKRLTAPSQYNLVSEELLEEHRWYSSEFLGENGENIYYTQILGDRMATNMNTEGATVYEIEINDQVIKCFESDVMNNIVWINEAGYFHLCGTCKIEVLIDMAKEVL